MNLVSSIALYFVLWWLCFFIALPIGTQSHAEQNIEVESGSEAASPVKHYLVLKMGVATIFGFVLLFCAQWILAQPSLQNYWK